MVVRQRTVERFVARLTLRELAPVWLLRSASMREPGMLRETRHRDTRSVLERVIEHRLSARERRETRLVERGVGIVIRSVPVQQATMRRAAVRIEHRAAFPALARTLVRHPAPPPAAAPTRNPGVPASVATADERRTVTRFGGPIGTPETASLPPAELARVTKHVIGELDRRVLSYRERTGQI